MKKYFSILSTMLLCLCLFGVTSCLKDSEVNNTLSLTGTFTVTGSYPSYTLVGDNGNRVVLTPESVSQLTDNKGFGDAKRLHALIVYNEKNLVEGADKHLTINDAEIKTAMSIKISNVCTVDEATTKNINVADSLFEVTSLVGAWVANGYLTTQIFANYSASGVNPVSPTLNVMLEETKTNEATLQLLYNRHTSKNVSPAGSTTFINSFEVSNLSIPGSADTIMVNIKAQGCGTKNIKVARKSLYEKL